MATDPITDLFNALKSSSLLRGVRVLLGPEAQTDQGAPSRVVMFPTRAGVVPYGDPADNVAEFAATLVFMCWGADYTRLHGILVGLAQAMWQYRLDTDIETKQVGITYDDTPDKTKEGRAATATFTLRLLFDKATVYGVGEVDVVQIEDPTGNPVVTIPPA